MDKAVSSMDGQTTLFLSFKRTVRNSMHAWYFSHPTRLQSTLCMAKGTRGVGATGGVP